MILLWYCHQFQNSGSSSINYWVIAIPLIGGWITLVVNLIFKNNQREKDIIDKLHSDIHAACDNILFSAVQVNGYALSKNFFYRKHLVNNFDKYFLALAIAHDAKMNEMLSKFYTHSSELIRYRYLMKKYLPKDLGNQIDAIIMKQDDGTPFIIKDYTQTFMNLTDAAMNNIFLAEQLLITPYVYTDSTGSSYNEIRRLIAGEPPKTQ